MAIRVWWELRERGGVFEVIHGHGRQHRDEDIVVAEVGVEGLREWECGSIIIKSRIHG